MRNQMYLVSESLRLLPKYGPHMSEADMQPLVNYKGFLDKSTKYVPSWVKIAVALALSLSTMIGWRRIDHGRRTHRQNAPDECAGARRRTGGRDDHPGADRFGLTVSTTHVLSSGVAGTMTANGNGLQANTLRSIAMARVFTLPAASLLSGGLFFLFNFRAR